MHRALYIPPTAVVMDDGRSVVAPSWWDPSWGVSEPVDWLVQTGDDLSLPKLEAPRRPVEPEPLGGPPAPPDARSAEAVFAAFRAAAEADGLPSRPDPSARPKPEPGLPPGWD